MESQPQQVEEHLQQEPPPSTDDPVEVDSQPTIAEIEETIAKADAEAATEPEGVQVETTESVTTDAVEQAAVSTYETIDDVYTKLDSMDDSLRAQVEPILALVSDQKAAFEKSSADFDLAMERMDQFMNDMRDYGIESEHVVNRFKEQETSIVNLNNACVETTWYAFQQLNPDYNSIPYEAKKTFGKVVNTMLKSFTGTNPLEKLQEAYKYTQYKYGLNKPTAAKSAPVAESKPVVNKTEPVNNDSKAQSLVNDSTTLHSEPVTSVDDLSWDEIMNRHLHLLE